MKHPIVGRVVLLLAMPVAAAAATVQARDASCSVESDYDLTLNEQSVILTRASGVPKWIVIRGDRLFIDDRWISLGREDRKRIAAFDRGIRETMPLARDIGRDAADIAFTALGEVAAGFSSDPAATRSRLETARAKIDSRLARAVTANRFNGDELGAGIGEAVGEVVPMVIGDIVGGAISAAFSGDTRRLQRLENLDKQIEAHIEPRARALEKRAEALCAKMMELDQLDSALAYRLPDGTALDLLQARPDTAKNREN